MTRYGMVIQLKPEKIEEYKKLHQHVWPEVLAILSKYHIKNYSIFLKDNLLSTKLQTVIVVKGVCVFFHI